MKTKFNLDDDLPLSKTMELRNMIIFVRSFKMATNISHKSSQTDICINNDKFYNSIIMLRFGERKRVEQEFNEVKQNKKNE